MIRPLARLCVFLFCLSLLPGCAIFKKRSVSKKRVEAEKAVAEAARRPLLVGRIALVNASDGFVLIDAATASLARSGASWRAYSGDAISAELRSTDVKRRPWVIADIVSGEPQTGDTVMQPAGEAEGTAPRAEAVTSVAPETPAAPAKRPPFWKRWFGRSATTPRA